MLDRLMALCASALACALAIYIAVRLIESVASTLVIIVAAIGGLVIVSTVVRLLWRQHRTNRW